jgi:hypothetical protein
MSRAFQDSSNSKWGNNLDKEANHGFSVALIGDLRRFH